jgi:hypothetical protein
MAAPQFTSNATLRLGGDIGLLRATTQLDVSRSSGAKMIPCTTGERGFTTGVSSAEVSCTIHVIRDSLQHKRLVAVFESQEVISYDYFDGSMHHPGDGVIGTLKISSQVNEAISYDISMAGADGTSTS